MNWFARLMDERFLNHRLRSTSAGGIAAATLAAILFAWHYYVDHEMRWELAAVPLTMIVVKWSLMAWYLTRE